eukprot:3615042-Rhodomonas_salina.1
MDGRIYTVSGIPFNNISLENDIATRVWSDISSTIRGTALHPRVAPVVAYDQKLFVACGIASP